MVLGSRHLVGIFILLVVLFGGVFTLGYLLGRNQYDTQLHAAASSLPAASPRPDVARTPPPAPASKSAENTDAAPAADWDFHSADTSEAPEKLAAQPKAVARSRPVTPAPASLSSRPGKSARAGRTDSGSSLNTPLIPNGATVLQVAALVRQADALALAQALQQKKFPAFVLNPGPDHFYRVQVGPFSNPGLANNARQRLETQGFKSIIKR